MTWVSWVLEIVNMILNITCVIVLIWGGRVLLRTLLDVRRSVVIMQARIVANGKSKEA